MPILPPSSVLAAAGAPNAARLLPSANLRQSLRKAQAPNRGEDEVIVGVEAIDKAQAVRGLQDNAQEQAREDHQQRDQFYAHGQSQPRHQDRESKRLDIAG